MKILMFPGPDTAQHNPYITIISNAIRAKKVRLSGWKPYHILKTGDVFHVHWPEIIPFIKHHKRKKFLYPFIEWNFFNTIKRIKKNNGLIIWTVHNLQPHDIAKLDQKEWHRFITKFSQQVDRYITLTNSSQGLIENLYPALKGKPNYVCHHPHYDIVNHPAPHLRQQFKIGEDEIVFGLIGALTKAKGADKLIQQFMNFPVKNAVLFLAGKPSEEISTLIDEARKNNSRIVVVPRFLTDQEVIDFHQMVDMTVFLSDTHLNSATVFQSLSNNVPVRLYETPTNTYLESIIGSEWLSFIENDNIIISDMLVSNLKKNHSNSMCNLNDFSPEKVASQHIQAYTKL